METFWQPEANSYSPDHSRKDVSAPVSTAAHLPANPWEHGAPHAPLWICPCTPGTSTGAVLLGGGHMPQGMARIWGSAHSPRVSMAGEGQSKAAPPLMEAPGVLVSEAQA